MSRSDDPTAEVTDLLQQLIRNQCVNDGTEASGEEARSVELLAGYLAGAGLDHERYQPRPGRESLVARIEGSDPTAPTLLLMGHTDVVPVNPDGWSRDPFGGELVDGEVWGRGAVDMLNLTASMAVAFRRLADSGFTPRGTVVYLAVADEEALGTWGARWLVEHELDAVRADYVLTEYGGVPMTAGDGSTRLPVLVAEKGTFWSKIRVRGTPGHGSQPYRTDNALVTAAEVVRRISAYEPETRVHETWERFVHGMNFPEDLRAALLDPVRVRSAIETFPLGFGRLVHACTHTTFAPTVMHAGTKTNVIPDSVDLEVDIRTLPGQSAAEVRGLLDDALGDLADHVEVISNDDPSTASPIDTPLWDSLARVTGGLCEGSALVPFLMVGGTDNRFFRRAGAVGYGFGLFSPRVRYEDFATMFHGNNERVDQESLRLSTELWEAVARDLVG
ncbi:MAG TPA: M20/M25/M40 family metallo-hydrolase [Acidimicrobiia bacterium]|nr:M20/M25/M40 family metallo-hydrolase [Acidimicrobiia bacterium]